MTDTATTKAKRLTTKADTAAADRLLKRAVATAVTMIRAGNNLDATAAVLTTATTAADLLLTPPVD